MKAEGVVKFVRPTSSLSGSLNSSSSWSSGKVDRMKQNVETQTTPSDVNAAACNERIQERLLISRKKNHTKGMRTKKSFWKISLNHKRVSPVPI